MKMLKTVVLVIAFALTMNVTVMAESYKTYVYTDNGKHVVDSVNLYSFSAAIFGEDTNAGSFNNPRDIFVDNEKRIYVADTGNNRIVVLSKEFKFLYEIKEFTIKQNPSKLNAPQGVFVSEDKEIYVADTQNSRIVIFSYTGEFLRELTAPVLDAITAEVSEFVYRPQKLAIDRTGRIYVVAQSVTMGIIQLSAEGEFEGFLGAQKVVYDPLTYFWKQIMTGAQIDRMLASVPTEYNNISIDAEGFLYVTSSAIDKKELLADIENPSTQPSVAPIKRLNPSGTDVLRRRGGISICGDLMVKNDKNEDKISGIVDVDIGPENTYVVLDSTRSRVFIYTFDGEMVGAFGEKGEQKANLQEAAAVAYKGDELLTLDAKAAKIVRYTPTSYLKTIFSALNSYNVYNYEISIEEWKKVLKVNPSSELAYIGIAKSLYLDERFEEAMHYYKMAGNTTGYSEAMNSYRDESLKSNLLFVLLGVVVIAFVLTLFVRFVSKCNRYAEETGTGEKGLHQILYGFYIPFHPFDGFWDLKHEKRGGMKGAVFWVVMAILGLTVNSIGSDYLFSPVRQGKGSELTTLYTILGFAAVFALWIIANWCLTTLFDGEGTIKDIFISTSYALLPMIVGLFLITGLSYLCTMDEALYLSLIQTICYGGTLLLVFIGNMTTHRFTLSKAVLMTVFTILGMAVIAFLVLVFVSIINQMKSFVTLIYNEITFRS